MSCRLEAQVQNGYTQLESLGAAEQFGSPQRPQQSSTAMQISQTPEADASEGVKLLLQKLKQANGATDRCHIPRPCPYDSLEIWAYAHVTQYTLKFWKGRARRKVCQGGAVG